MTQPAATTPSPRIPGKPVAPAGDTPEGQPDDAVDGTTSSRGAGRADGQTSGIADLSVADPAGAPVTALIRAVDVERAAGTLAGVARLTRVVRHQGLSRRTRSPIWLKLENEQHTRSFKLRGAYNRVAQAGPGQRARGLVAASAGNHAQGVAFAAAQFGVESTIFVPTGANPVKVARTRRWGARVEHTDGGVDAALAAAEAYAADGGRLMVHPFDDPAVIAGQGTVGLELLDQVPGLRTVIVGIGGGGLATGIAVAFAARQRDVRVVGVQAAAAPAFADSFRAGERLSAPADTVADGMAVRTPGRLTLALAAALLDDVVTVDESAFWEAMVLLRRTGDHLVEPAGAAGVAALLRHPELAEGPTAVILSGGNVDLATADRVIALATAATIPIARTS
ncbi:pyridoxal-phosphate dependent enzyme [Frankia sp. CNm7]|uniref:threonine ammonia-lyase n=1 Tax=Frankia nepalensis TaxID=1836974 RepID=A0A937UKW0_9ACTN|nr:pyridoxal-phosphate dependent enzyme [Frankia nepalensis]MBL7501656.1 pyridoxal-phosphate dependent enzyme [Frankia nepalensis]MBL7512586.1 pyridoxal-phosphate dependent enzyme [Frankia nepalensis]MBL7521423.1 pyridoxal-phosphate dependent enzyme [Frankia nepalensis]MBL7627209.1 pyridoxal-phosphate dependent enzyme [Frankia nepalensis]